MVGIAPVQQSDEGAGVNQDGAHRTVLSRARSDASPSPPRPHEGLQPLIGRARPRLFVRKPGDRLANDLGTRLSPPHRQTLQGCFGLDIQSYGRHPEVPRYSKSVTHQHEQRASRPRVALLFHPRPREPQPEILHPESRHQLPLIDVRKCLRHRAKIEQFGWTEYTPATQPRLPDLAVLELPDC